MILKGEAAKLGYKNNSPYKNAKSLTIDFGKKGGIITMKNVSKPLLGVPDKGKPTLMYPNKDYSFPEASKVTEYPMKIQKQYRTIGIQPKFQTFRNGGIIVGGVLHSEKNNMGDFGVPVVPLDSFNNGGKYIKNHKIAEIEKEELILNRETSSKIERLMKEYDECGCGNKLIQIGLIVKDALKNTSDETCRVECKYEPMLRNIK